MPSVHFRLRTSYRHSGRLVQCPSNPISQVLKRVHESESASFSICSIPFAERRMKVAANCRDSVVLLKTGKFAEVVMSEMMVCCVKFTEGHACSHFTQNHARRT